MEEYLYYGSSKQSTSSNNLSSPKYTNPKVIVDKGDSSAYSKKRHNERRELLRIHDLTTSNKNKLSSMEDEISKCLEKMDQINAVKPYIDKRQIYEIKHVYGKHGKYEQIILTTYTEYTDDCFSDISLPPIPDQKDENKEIENENEEIKEVDDLSDTSIDSKLINAVELEINAYGHNENNENNENDHNDAKSERVRTVSFRGGKGKDSWTKFKKNMIQLMIYK